MKYLIAGMNDDFDVMTPLAMVDRETPEAVAADCDEYELEPGEILLVIPVVYVRGE
jgi:hypothetical protein